jgi:hypothetical protein
LRAEIDSPDDIPTLFSPEGRLRERDGVPLSSALYPKSRPPSLTPPAVVGISIG